MLGIDIKAVDTLARRRFTYRVISTDHWGVYAKEVLAGAPWSGDCIDLVSTVMELLAERGQPLNRIWRLLVIDQDSDGSVTQPNHAVCAVEDDAGEFWIVADTFATAYAASALKHRPFCSNRLDEIDAANEPTWRAGLPWSAA